MSNLKEDIANIKEALNLPSVPENVKASMRTQLTKLESKLKSGQDKKPATKVTQTPPHIIKKIYENELKELQGGTMGDMYETTAGVEARIAEIHKELDKLNGKKAAPKKRKSPAKKEAKYKVGQNVLISLSKGEVAKITKVDHKNKKYDPVYTVKWKEKGTNEIQFSFETQDAIKLAPASSKADYDCDDLIDKEIQRKKKKAKTAKKSAEKTDSKKNVDRVEKAGEVVEKSIKERMDAGEKVEIKELEKLKDEYVQAVKELNKLLKISQRSFSGGGKVTKGGVDYDCDELIAAAKARLAKTKKATKKREAKPEPKQQKERVEKSVEVTEENIWERVKKKERVTTGELFRLISAYEKIIAKIDNLIKKLKDKEKSSAPYLLKKEVEKMKASKLLPQDEKYTYYEDPGHAWLQVSHKELNDLGIEKEISGFSYSKGDYAYLEEDQDATTFFNAFGDKGQAVLKSRITEKYEERTPIRNYAGYSPKKTWKYEPPKAMVIGSDFAKYKPASKMDKALSYTEYVKQVKNYLKKDYSVDIKDIDEKTLKQAHKDTPDPLEFVEWWTTKYDITRPGYHATGGELLINRPGPDPQDRYGQIQRPGQHPRPHKFSGGGIVYQVAQITKDGSVEAVSKRYDSFKEALAAKKSPDQFISKYDDLGTGEVRWVADYNDKGEQANFATGGKLDPQMTDEAREYYEKIYGASLDKMAKGGKPLTEEDIKEYYEMVYGPSRVKLAKGGKVVMYHVVEEDEGTDLGTYSEKELIELAQEKEDDFYDEDDDEDPKEIVEDLTDAKSVLFKWNYTINETKTMSQGGNVERARFQAEREKEITETKALIAKHLSVIPHTSTKQEALEIQEEVDELEDRLDFLKSPAFMEDRGFSKGGSTDWLQKVTDNPKFRKGAFTRKAKAAGLTTTQLMREVLNNKSDYDERTVHQAQFMANATGISYAKGGKITQSDVDKAFSNREKLSQKMFNKSFSETSVKENNSVDDALTDKDWNLIDTWAKAEHKYQNDPNNTYAKGGQLTDEDIKEYYEKIYGPARPYKKGGQLTDEDIKEYYERIYGPTREIMAKGGAAGDPNCAFCYGKGYAESSNEKGRKGRSRDPEM